MVGVTKVFPLPKILPPVELAYQLIVPALEFAPSVNTPVPQREDGVVEVIVGVVFTVAKTEVLLELHPALVALT